MSVCGVTVTGVAVGSVSSMGVDSGTDGRDDGETDDLNSNLLCLEIFFGLFFFFFKQIVTSTVMFFVTLLRSKKLDSISMLD